MGWRASKLPERAPTAAFGPSAKRCRSATALHSVSAATELSLDSARLISRLQTRFVFAHAARVKITVLLALAITAHAADLTIYNQGFAVVRDAVPLDLHAGINEVRFTRATAQVEPDSVILRDPSGKAALQILEQNYRNDPVSQSLLLSMFEGQSLDFVRREPQKPDEIVKGKVVRSGYTPGARENEAQQPIIEVDGKLQFSLPGEPRFPTLGDDTVLKPVLSWKLNAEAAAKFDAELAYVSGGFSWVASYNVVQPENGDALDIAGWVTIGNESGSTFAGARIKLMAGDVSKRPRPERGYSPPEVPQNFGGSGPVVSEKAFDEFHLYTLPNPTTLRDRETKQVEFIRTSGVKAERLYVYDGARLDRWTVGENAQNDPAIGLQSNRKVAVYRTFLNSEANHLGAPLPKGTIRFYTRDATDGSLQFVGENQIDHTAKGERVRAYVGNSFDLTGERKRMDFKVSEANKRTEESFEIKVRNHKKEPAEVLVTERLYRWRAWEIVAKSQDYEKTDAQSIEFRVMLGPDEEKAITYKVRYAW